MWAKRTTLLGLDVGRPDNLGPLLGFVGDQPAEVCRRARQGRADKVGKPRFHCGIEEGCIDLLVELVNNFDRRVSWRANAKPGACFITREELADSREVR